MSNESEKLRAEVGRLRAELAEVQRWRTDLNSGRGILRPKAVVVADHRGVERVVVGCPDDHPTPDMADACADTFGVTVNDERGRLTASLVGGDGADTSLQLWTDDGIALSVDVAHGLRRFGRDGDKLDDEPEGDESRDPQPAVRPVSRERVEHDIATAEAEMRALRRQADALEETVAYLRETMEALDERDDGYQGGEPPERAPEPGPTGERTTSNRLTDPGKPSLPGELAFDRLFDELYDRLGHQDAMLAALDDAVGDLVDDAIAVGAAKQREIIAGALDGRLTWTPGSYPDFRTSWRPNLLSGAVPDGPAAGADTIPMPCGA